MPSRWDFLYDVKPQPIGDFLLDKLAEVLEEDIRAFPPEVTDWQDEAAKARFERAVAAGHGPSELAVRTAIWLAQADLRREFEAVDEFMRGGGLDDRLGSDDDRELCRFLWHFLEDKVLSFAEATQSRFKRAELADALARLEKRLYRVTVA
ncbi:MAG TPA: hypothetical protein VMB50_18720 [Myxococcales bacterium]|nr:hypothetical protein [Myxococcales bacterium]